MNWYLGPVDGLMIEVIVLFLILTKDNNNLFLTGSSHNFIPLWYRSVYSKSDNKAKKTFFSENKLFDIMYQLRKESSLQKLRPN